MPTDWPWDTREVRDEAPQIIVLDAIRGRVGREHKDRPASFVSAPYKHKGYIILVCLGCLQT